MFCPTCHKSLRPKEVPKKMIIWVCDSCLGVAANMSVLRQYLAGGIVKEFWLKTINESTQSDRKCPSCTQPLNEFSTSKDDQRISLDLCKSCQLIWFDKDELEAFPKTKAETACDIAQQLALAQARFEAEPEGREGLVENICFAGFQIFRLVLRLLLRF